MLILSFILLALGRTIPKLSPQLSNLILETGIDNMATLIEELGIKSKAVYLPPSLTNGRPHVLIPLHANSTLPPINKPLPHRLIVRYGAAPENVGLLLSAFGSTAVDMLESKPGPTSVELKMALTSLLTGILGIADGARVAYHENRIMVEIYNPRIENRATWCHECLGGPVASIVASVAAKALDKPVTIKQERYVKGKCSVELDVVG